MKHVLFPFFRPLATFINLTCSNKMGLSLILGVFYSLHITDQRDAPWLSCIQMSRLVNVLWNLGTASVVPATDITSKHNHKDHANSSKTQHSPSSIRSWTLVANTTMKIMQTKAEFGTAPVLLAQRTNWTLKMRDTRCLLIWLTCIYLINTAHQIQHFVIILAIIILAALCWLKSATKSW